MTTHTQPDQATAVATAIAAPPEQGFASRLEDPMGSVIAASVLTMGSFGIVLSGIWFVNLFLQ